ncbi:DsbA family oxidoreductase [Parvularcula dongshanensis]|uniref:Putative DsbA family dithiol-disulfide isomerase n=1 Tax=Parvularcula dongshanensis TaxID=1173995 RepID=A0A840I3D2_9PROT|nr:DsbA family oxidoreductase [Parvularcula dongshanensis]MBB4658835.1 putative DsbA family dithiol-disulfide isomerase [Parvularcula dongshanensis]
MSDTDTDDADEAVLTIDLVTDPVCPWCYVGHVALGWPLIALSMEGPVALRYRPYRLAPDTPPGGMDRKAALKRKVPDAGQRAAMTEALKEAMRDAGVSFDPDRPEWLPDTLDAHRVIRWAHEDNLQRDVAGAIFEAYWQRGEDIGDRTVLSRLAGRAGMDADEVAARLETQEDRTDVAEEAAAFRAGGVGGVPAFIVNEEAGFEGALPRAQMLDAIRQLAAETG